jgi:predicted nucleic acid-binding protein
MNELFADTSFFVSFLNPRDTHHPLAAHYMDDYAGPIVTTALILVELGNFLSGSGNRRLFIPFARELRADKRFRILPSDQSLIDGGMLQYERSSDQKWSFTDCASFALMQRRKMTEALTADHHFEQAGFVVLLK